MVEQTSAFGRGQQSAALDAPSNQPEKSSNIINEFASGVWQGSVTNKVNGVAQLFGADVKTPEVKRNTAQTVAHTAGEVTGDLIDFMIMTKFAGNALAKFAPEIAATSKVGEYVALNPVGRNMAVGGTVGLVNGMILTPTKEGESGWNRIGRGVTDAATFATLGGVATKLAPMAEGTGFMGRMKMNAYSGAAAGAVNSEVDGLMHGRQVGLGEMATNTAAWTLGNVAFGEALHGLGAASKKFMPKHEPFEASVSNMSGLKDWEVTVMKRDIEAARAKVAASTGASTEAAASTGATAEATVMRSVANEPQDPKLLEGVRAASKGHVEDGHSHGAGKGDFKSVVEEGAAVDPANPRRLQPGESAKVTEVNGGEPVDGARGENTLPAMRVAVAPKEGEVKVAVEGDAAGAKKGEGVEGEVAQTRDRTRNNVMLDKGETLSMRELYAKNPDEADKLLAEYMGKLEKAFPLEGEIESAAVYKEYLTKPGGTWDMVVLRDKAQNIVGGIQYQVIDVNGQQIGKAAWGEHIWLDEASRNAPNFYGLLSIARESIQKAKGEIVFMEFNNPDKMSVEQMLMDEAAGLSAKDREKIWGRTGIHVLVDSKGKVLEYGQPAMSSEDPPVMFLSLGFISTKPLGGQMLPKEDYLKLMHAAHKTIPSVNIETDATVKWYTDAVNATGENAFTYVPLNALGIAREAGQKAAQEAMQRETAKHIAKVMSTTELKDAIAKLVAENRATPEALQALVEQAALQSMLAGAHKGK